MHPPLLARQPLVLHLCVLRHWAHFTRLQSSRSEWCELTCGSAGGRDGSDLICLSAPLCCMYPGEARWSPFISPISWTGAEQLGSITHTHTHTHSRPASCGLPFTQRNPRALSPILKRHFTPKLRVAIRWKPPAVIYFLLILTSVSRLYNISFIWGWVWEKSLFWFLVFASVFNHRSYFWRGLKQNLIKNIIIHVVISWVSHIFCCLTHWGLLILTLYQKIGLWKWEGEIKHANSISNEAPPAEVIACCICKLSRLITVEGNNSRWSHADLVLRTLKHLRIWEKMICPITAQVLFERACPFQKTF